MHPELLGPFQSAVERIAAEKLVGAGNGEDWDSSPVDNAHDDGLDVGNCPQDAANMLEKQVVGGVYTPSVAGNHRALHENFVGRHTLFGTVRNEVAEQLNLELVQNH